ncbi:MAG: exodeoxyribonuclease III [Burkholderiaceae bacterium]
MKIATWNINSLKVRLPHVLAWLEHNPVEVLALQETKLPDDRFPSSELEAIGYRAVFSGQKTYNGVAILARLAMAATDVSTGIAGFDDDHKRVISATVNGIRVVCVYVPNGQSVDSDKYQYKLRWFAGLLAWLQEELKAHPRLVVLGDYNVAPEDRDVHDPRAWEGQVLCSQPERDALQSIAALGLHDAFRLFEQAPKSYSWWDYRMLGFRRNAGLRIDHVLLSDALRPLCTACTIDREERKREQPSDHAPVIATLELDRSSA